MRSHRWASDASVLSTADATLTTSAGEMFMKGCTHMLPSDDASRTPLHGSAGSGAYNTTSG